MIEELEPRADHIPAPSLYRQVGAVAQTVLLLDIRPSRIARKQRPAVDKCAADVQENPRQLLGRDMEEDGVGKDPVEAFRW